MAKMEKIGCFGLTEPDHGSDAVALETIAEQDGDELQGLREIRKHVAWYLKGFAVGSEGGELVVTHTRRSTAAATYTIWAVWALTLVAALPLRRGKEMAS